jgi:hypothetical protein
LEDFLVTVTVRNRNRDIIDDFLNIKHYSNEIIRCRFSVFVFGQKQLKSGKVENMILKLGG